MSDAPIRRAAATAATSRISKIQDGKIKSGKNPKSTKNEDSGSEWEASEEYEEDRYVF